MHESMLVQKKGERRLEGGNASSPLMFRPNWCVFFDFIRLRGRPGGETRQSFSDLLRLKELQTRQSPGKLHPVLL